MITSLMVLISLSLHIFLSVKAFAGADCGCYASVQLVQQPNSPFVAL